MNSNIVKDQTLYAEGQIFDAVVIKNINILFDVSIRYILRKTEFNMYDLKCIFKDVYNECEALNIIPSPCNIFITVVDENENNFLLGYVPIEPCNIGKCLVNGLISISKKKFDSDIHQIQQKNRSEAANYNCKTSFLKKTNVEVISTAIGVGIAHEFTHAIYSNLSNEELKLELDSLELLTDAIAYCATYKRFKEDTIYGAYYLIKHLKAKGISTIDNHIEIKNEACSIISELITRSTKHPIIKENNPMDEKEIARKTSETAQLYFKGVKDEDKPYTLWRTFDKELAKQMSLYITGQFYSREKIPHTTRQLVTVSALTALSKPDELKLHIHAALNVGCTKEEIAEVIFQTSIYAGVPAANAALKVLKEVLEEKDIM